MSGKTNIDRRTARRQATAHEIVAAAWDVVREHGLAALSLRDLGDRVGMRAQSIYSYFESKNEIYDAMFLEGYQAFARWMAEASDQAEALGDPTGEARHVAHRFLEFCTCDPARYQLLFQRTIPGFEPSPGSWAVALEAYEIGRRHLARLGFADQGSLDLWTAVLTGLADQQLANDPGGDRWTRLVDRAVDLLLRDLPDHRPEAR